MKLLPIYKKQNALSFRIIMDRETNPNRQNQYLVLIIDKTMHMHEALIFTNYSHNFITRSITCGDWRKI